MLVTCAPSFVISLGWITVLTAGSMPHKQSCCLALSSTSATPVIAGACAEMHTLYAFCKRELFLPCDWQGLGGKCIPMQLFLLEGNAAMQLLPCSNKHDHLD